jgi:CheY-like chemotaxis protein/HPt (histidine-containing phosphotransfer) domain-containing protein
MKNFLRKIKQLMTVQDFKKQLVAAIAIAIIVSSVLSTLVITRLSSSAISENLSEKGKKITEVFADQTILGLLVGDASNVEDAVQAILQFPDVAGVGIYDINRMALLERSLTTSISNLGSLPTNAELISQTSDAWHFFAPVFYTQESEDDFYIEESIPELLGYVVVEMHKSSLNNLVEGIRNVNIIITLLLAMMLMLVLLSVTQRITKPIKQLMNLMGRAQQGERKVRADLFGPQDVRQMEAAFNTMIIALEDRERELLSARDKALESAKVKGEFAANVSHELRTPLNGILGMLELLSGMGLSPKQREYINIARSSSDALLLLIDDILDFSKIDSGKLEILYAEFNLYELMDDVVSIMSTQAQVKDIDLTYSICDPVPTYVKGDVRRIRQLLINLCGNAIKFTSEGEVSIRVLLTDETQSNLNLRFEVEDTGIGIPKFALEKIFDAFSQADNSTTRKYGGTGLGLAICRQLVNALDGEIGVTSREHHGSTFYFTLPMQYSSSSQQNTTQADFDSTQARCLVVDDSERVRSTVCNMLKNWGADADAVSSGDLALSVLKQATQDDKAYDVIIVDESMPSINGIELLRKIADESEISHVKRLLMTNQTHTESFLERFTAIDACLQKPVLQSNLYDHVIALLKGMAVRDDLRDESLLEKKFIANDIRVLVAEDNSANQEVAIGMLERLGCKVVIAYNGIEVINLLMRERFDMILMDCNMPEMDGYEATHEIRKLKDANAKIPIVAMTANVQEGDHQKCLDAGMDDYLSKPLKIKNIRIKLEQWIPNSISEKLDPAVTNQSSEISAIDLVGSFSIKRINELKESVGDVFDAMLSAFMEDIQISVRSLGAAIHKKDFEGIKHYTHTIKGSSKNFGAHELVNITREIEDMCKTGVISSPDEIVKKLEQEMTCVVTGIQSVKTRVAHKSVTYPKKDNTQTILIADDDCSMRLALVNVLDADGYQLYEATNGHQAINFCKNNMPDLVLLDAVMPEINGLEACKKIRQLNDSSHVPILIITALDDEESVEHAFRVGATDYLSKPVHFSVLRQRIARLLYASRVEKHVR